MVQRFSLLTIVHVISNATELFPQAHCEGSALGPLLWNIFENDFTYEIKSNVSMYADDHQLYEMGKDLAKVKSSLAGNAEKASRWYEVNLLKGNFGSV